MTAVRDVCSHGLADHGCDRSVAFPRCPDNRPGLPRIERRIGTYPDIRAFLIDRLNHEPLLRTWTHRQPDDPGIALLEGTAIVGDILTFYQELYANEAYLRTAAWRESVAALVKLIGYRLSPGVGGRGIFAIEIRGTEPVTVPAGLPLSAQVTGLDGTTDLLTSEAIVAYPWLSRFSLCRPVTTPVISGETRELVVTGGPDDLDLQPGQRLLVGPGASAFQWSTTEIVVIDSVRQRLGETLVTIKGHFRQLVPTQALVAYRIGRSFRHFGHNAPPTSITVVNDKATSKSVSFDRGLGSWTWSTWSDRTQNIELAPTDVPLDTTVTDLPPGSTVICQVAPPPRAKNRPVDLVAVRQVLPPPPPISYGPPTSDPFNNPGSFIEEAIESLFGISPPKPPSKPPPPPPGRAVVQTTVRETINVARVILGDSPMSAVRTVVEVRQGSLTWGSLTGGSTVLALDGSIAEVDAAADIRNIQVHEATSPRLRLLAAEVPTGETSGSHVGVVGSAAEVAVLPGRRLLLAPPVGRPTVVTVAEVDAPPSAVPASVRHLRSIRLDAVVPYADLGPNGSPIVVHGNVFDATQGKLEREEPIGSGDARATFQTMPLPKQPLTYLTTAGNTPPETPELEVFVDGRRWRRVPSLFGQAAIDEIYVVREDDDGRSWVQFGDGKTGARLPSGVDNVVVRYRTGAGAHGPLVPDTSVQAGARVDRLDKIRLPGEVTGGDEPEDRDNAREAAPGKVQGLGRLVSLRDFETETLAIPGVSRVRAAWRLVDNVPSTVVTVLMVTGRETEIDQVRGIVASSDRRRGTARFPVIVVGGRRRYFGLTLTVATDGVLRDADVVAAVRRELRVAGLDEDEDGTAGRGFGEREYATRIEGQVQAVPGVRWTHVDTMQVNPTLIDLLNWSGQLQQIARVGGGALPAAGAAGLAARAAAGRAPQSIAISSGAVSAYASASLALAPAAAWTTALASPNLASPARRLALDALEERAIRRLGGVAMRDLQQRLGRQPRPTRVLVPGADEILALRTDDLAIAVVSPTAAGADA
jgi:hypothetical protein